jgi:hypothetical protein
MTPQSYGFEDEFAFFEAATRDENAYRQYRDWIVTVAQEEVARVSATSSLDAAVLLAAAMEPFDRAFRLYRARDAKTPLDYPFSKYFRWWARQYASARAHRP